MVKLERLRSFIAEKGFDWEILGAALDLPFDFTQTAIWDYPALACAAAGGADSDAIEVVVLASFCSTLSIRLVDDILDDDPVGFHVRWGAGRTANLALAFEAIASMLIERLAIPHDRRRRIQEAVLRGGLNTSFGQDADFTGVKSEIDYWRITRLKTAPLFETGFEMGSVLAGADDELILQMMDFGKELALHIQISDDMSDAMAVPARDDWTRPLNNLAMHYAMTVDHPDRSRFIDLAPCVHEPSALKKAQEILGQCGAMSYCVWNLIENYKKLVALYEAMVLKDRTPIYGILHNLASTLQGLLESAGATTAEARGLLLAQD